MVDGGEQQSFFELRFAPPALSPESLSRLRPRVTMASRVGDSHTHSRPLARRAGTVVPTLPARSTGNATGLKDDFLLYRTTSVKRATACATPPDPRSARARPTRSTRHIDPLAKSIGVRMPSWRSHGRRACISRHMPSRRSSRVAAPVRPPHCARLVSGGPHQLALDRGCASKASSRGESRSDRRPLRLRPFSPRNSTPGEGARHQARALERHSRAQGPTSALRPPER